MNIDHQGLDPQLRAALSQEAEMQNAPEPDVDRLIVRGKVRQRHRNMVRAGAVAAVAVLVAGGVGYSLTRVDAGSSSGPAPTHSPKPSHASAPVQKRPSSQNVPEALLVQAVWLAAVAHIWHSFDGLSVPSR